MLEIETAHGPARVHLHHAPDAVGALVLGHGAGGGVTARDLVTVTKAAQAEGFTVALVEQPYRVAGRRSPAPARQLDRAWLDVVERLKGDELSGLPLVVGGRSSGARVACRTAAETGAVGVLCLAFPLVAPGRSRGGGAAGRAGAGAGPAGGASGAGAAGGASGAGPASRQGELDAVSVPTLVIQGAGDPFGMPAPGKTRRIAVVAGNHSLTSDLEAVAREASGWLRALAGSSIRNSTTSR